MNKAAYEDSMNFLNLQQLIPSDIMERLARLRECLRVSLEPIIADCVESAQFPFQIIPEFKKLGIVGLEQEGYGCRKISSLEKALILYEISKIDAGVATFYIVHACLAIASIEILGTEEQKQKYLKKMVDFELIGCFGLSEPEYGSDASSLKTSAKPILNKIQTGNEGYIINGTKRWIGNASHSDIIVVWARNTATNQVEGFIVNSKSAGVEIKLINQKLALRTTQNCEIVFKDVFVHEDHKLQGSSFSSGVNKVLGYSRKFVVWVAIGIMSKVYEVSLKYSKTRFQFQVPISSFQITQEKLVRILGYFNAAFLQGWRLVTLEKFEIFQSAAVKAWVTLVGRETTKLAREILGGNGILIENYVMKAMLDMEALYTYEGTYEINSLVVGRYITGIPAFKSNYKL